MSSDSLVKTFEDGLDKLFREMKIPIVKFGRDKLANTIEANRRLLGVFTDIVDTIDSVATQWYYAASIQFWEFRTGKREVPEEVVRRMFNAVLTTDEFYDMIRELVDTYQSVAGASTQFEQTATALAKIYQSASDEERKEMLADLLSYSLEAVEVLFIFMIVALLKALPPNEAPCARDRLRVLLEAAKGRKETVPFPEILNLLRGSGYIDMTRNVLERAYGELVAIDNEHFEFYENMLNALARLKSLGECRPRPPVVSA